MLKVVIADDEARILQLIKKLVNWDELGIQLIGEADNGPALFELIRTHAPDIVITDIRMPGMEGIEVVRKTRELRLNTRFIIISGYQHFEYAQNAIKYGVEDYLVKPINKDELIATLARLRDRVLEHSGRLESEQLMKSQLERSQEKLRLQFMNALLSAAPEQRFVDSLAAANDEYQLHFQPGIFQALVLKIDHRHKEIDEQHLGAVIDRVPDLVEKALAERCDELVISRSGPALICVLNYPEARADAVKKCFKQLFEDVRRHLETHDGFRLTIGVGSMERELPALPLSMAAARAAVNSRVLLGGNRIIDLTGAAYAPATPRQVLTPARLSQFSTLVEVFDVDGIREWIEAVYQELQQIKNLHPARFSEVALEIASQFFAAARQFNGQIEDGEREEGRLLQQLNDAASVDELKTTLVTRISEILDAILQSRRAQDNKPIRMAKQYISEHFAEAINLEDVARVVHLNAVYLSVVFKKETGITFTDYLINIRLDAAKQLLRETRLNLTEIAERVGYRDAKYFSKLFTRVVGINPQEYRKLYS